MQYVICMTRIRLLRNSLSLTAQREARDEKPAGRFFNQLLNGNVKKEVDETKKSLHNLVSLLLTQQRSKRR
ncbi:hypothetical protein, partial [Paraburkholderia sp.]|uniref:hypothetical protein n=1 Tax=Paraburkholderia sp. TaxID=1926495 RepID=UPI00286F2E6C